MRFVFMQEPYDEIPYNDYATIKSDQQPVTGYEGLEAQGLAEFQRRKRLPRLYDAVEPRVYVDTTNPNQQLDTSRDVNVTGDPPGGYEGLEAQEPHVYTAVKPRN